MLHRHKWGAPEKYVVPDSAGGWPHYRYNPERTTLVYRCTHPDCTKIRREHFEGALAAGKEETSE